MQTYRFAKSGQNTTLEEGVIFWQSHFVYKRHAHTQEQFTHTKSTTAQIAKNYFAKARYLSYLGI